jgi:hypothetical protein
MIKLSVLIFSISTITLLAENQIQITGIVKANANTQMKMIYANNNTIQQDIFVQTNHRGMTLSLADGFSSSDVWLNNNHMNSSPLDFSNEIHAKPTKVGELIISQKKNKKSLGIIVSIK